MHGGDAPYSQRHSNRRGAVQGHSQVRRRVSCHGARRRAPQQRVPGCNPPSALARDGARPTAPGSPRNPARPPCGARVGVTRGRCSKRSQPRYSLLGAAAPCANRHPARGAPAQKRAGHVARVLPPRVGTALLPVSVHRVPHHPGLPAKEARRTRQHSSYRTRLARARRAWHLCAVVAQASPPHRDRRPCLVRGAASGQQLRGRAPRGGPRLASVPCTSALDTAPVRARAARGRGRRQGWLGPSCQRVGGSMHANCSAASAVSRGRGRLPHMRTAEAAVLWGPPAERQRALRAPQTAAADSTGPLRDGRPQQRLHAARSVPAA